MSLLEKAAFYALLGARLVWAQGTSKRVQPLLDQPLLTTSAVASDELDHLLLRAVPPLELSHNSKAWDRKAEELPLRELTVLDHGWPETWLAVSNPHAYDRAPELYCLDLCCFFDINTLQALAPPSKVNFDAKAPVRIFWH